MQAGRRGGGEHGRSGAGEIPDRQVVNGQADEPDGWHETNDQDEIHRRSFMIQLTGVTSIR
jgi:hypothetical protein